MGDAPAFRVAATMHLRHGRLAEVLREKGWTQAQLATYLGVSQNHVSDWMRFRRRPPTNPEVLRKLMELTGWADEDLFPPAIYLRPARERPATQQTVIHALAPEALMARCPPRLPTTASAEEVYATREQETVLQDVMTHALLPRERDILTRHFGLNGVPSVSINDLACEMGLSRGRIGQIAATAVMKLRRPSCLRLLRPLATGERLAPAFLAPSPPLAPSSPPSLRADIPSRALRGEGCQRLACEYQLTPGRILRIVRRYCKKVNRDLYRRVRDGRTSPPSLGSLRMHAEAFLASSGPAVPHGVASSPATPSPVRALSLPAPPLLIDDTPPPHCLGTILVPADWIAIEHTHPMTAAICTTPRPATRGTCWCACGTVRLLW